jgi:co-chaperonin GroES (HSP10)
VTDLSETRTSTSEHAKLASQLPKPTGYHILCAVPEIVEKFDNSELIKPDITVANESILTMVLFVVDLGPDCYNDPIKFPSGPWCQKGDFILCRSYTGMRLNIHGKEFALITDDSVIGTAEDPRGIRRR